MKLTLTAFLLSATAAMAGTENVTGCETVPIAGSNATQRADVTCALPSGGGNGTFAVSFLFADLVNKPADPVEPPDEEEPEDPVDPPDEEDPVDPPADDDPVDPPADDPPADDLAD